MKRTVLHFLSGFLLAVLLTPVSSSAQVAPTTLAYQGYLTDTDGNPLDGTVNLAFRLYDAPTGGNALWAESQLDVPVSEGVFAANLGAVEPLDEVAFDRPLWLAVHVNGGNELSPRVALTAAPYSLSTRGLRVIPAEDEDDPPSIIAGDASNAIEGDRGGATISGGADNIASRGATVGGGEDNAALSCYDTVAGGVNNRAEGLAGGSKASGARCGATVGGGNSNVANNETATVGGGYRNEASGSSAIVGGGNNNVASGSGSTIGGGWSNRTDNSGATVSGGRDNIASGISSTVPGGSDNHARGRNSFAAGYYARAAHDGSFVWSDNSQGISDSLVTTAEDQFLIRATGGVGIGTNAPQGALHVTHPTDDFDLVLGGAEDDPLFGDDGIIVSDPNLPSSDLLFASNDAVAVMLDTDNDGDDLSEFIVIDSGFDEAFRVNLDGVVTTGNITLENELGQTDTPPEGGIYKDNVVYAWAHVNADGSVDSSYGCTVSRRTGSGSYRVTFNRSLPSGVSAIVTPKGLNDVVLASVVTTENFADVATKTFNGSAFVFFDSGFYIQVVGRP